ncbi:MAG TPA: 30S ribosomal protein S9, partial [Polymorphobacter sp.]|nr:30S ribosomal protein S9 [Polymorphobacter sp.]
MSDDTLDTRQSLADLGTLTEAGALSTANDGVSPAPLREQKIDAHGRAYATGKRKDAVARVWLKPGTGKVTVNGRDQTVYFARPTLRLVINQPFTIADRIEAEFIVAGGGHLEGRPDDVATVDTSRLVASHVDDRRGAAVRAPL